MCPVNPVMTVICHVITDSLTTVMHDTDTVMHCHAVMSHVMSRES